MIFQTPTTASPELNQKQEKQYKIREDKIHSTYNCKYPTVPSASIYTFGIQRPAMYLIHGQDASGQPYGKYSSTDIQKWSTIYDASYSKPSRIYWDGNCET